MPRHKHADVIIAWANGEEIEFRTMDSADWLPMNREHPTWYEYAEYRVKPKTVKREGWVNIYKDKPENSLFMGRASPIYKSKEQADIYRETDGKICIRIEWEEEV